MLTDTPSPNAQGADRRLGLPALWHHPQMPGVASTALARATRQVRGLRQVKTSMTNPTRESRSETAASSQSGQCTSPNKECQWPRRPGPHDTAQRGMSSTR